MAFKPFVRYPQLMKENPTKHEWGQLIRAIEQNDRNLVDYIDSAPTGGATSVSIGLSAVGTSSFLAVTSPVANEGNLGITFVSGPTNTYLSNTGAWASVASGGGSGTVTSVGATNVGNPFSITGSPVSTAGNLTFTFVSGPTNTYLSNTGAWTSITAGGGSGTVTSVGITNVGNPFVITGSPVSTAGNVTLTFTSGPANTLLNQNGGWTANEFSSVSTALVSLGAAATSTNVALDSTNAVVTSIKTVVSALQPNSRNLYFTDYFPSTNQQSPFLGAAIGAGTLTFVGISVDPLNHPGIARLNAAAVNTGYGLITNNVAFLLGGGEETNHIVLHEKVTAAVFRCGFLDSSNTALPVDAVMFEMSTNGAVVGKNISNSAVTVTPVLINAASSVWYRYKASLDSAGTTAIYQIYDTAGATLVSTNLTGNIPTGPGRHTGAGILAYTVVAGVSGVIAAVDYSDIKINRTLSRGGIVT